MGKVVTWYVGDFVNLAFTSSIRADKVANKGSVLIQLGTYNPIFHEYLGNSSYYKGPNGYPMISTYSSGGMNNTQWQGKKSPLYLRRP